MFDYVELRDDLAPQCATLELHAFPHAAPADLISEEDFRVYTKTFPEGLLGEFRIKARTRLSRILSSSC